MIERLPVTTKTGTTEQEEPVSRPDRGYTCCASRALWPNRTRRRVETSRGAQWRRFFVMKKRTGRIGSKLIDSPYFFTMVIVVAFLSGAVVMAACMLHYWSMLGLLIVLWLLTMIVTSRLVFDEKLWQPGESTALKSISMRLVPRSFKRSTLPVSPHIRVLETINMAESDMQQFISPLWSDEMQGEL